MTKEPDLGEQALDTVAEVAISSQLDEAKQVDVDIRTDPVKLVQGKLDSVAISGKGMTMKRDLRVDSVQVNANTVAIDPLKAIAGELELTEPLNAQTRILLTEADLNRALASDYLRTKMQNLQIKHEGESIPVSIEQAVILLKENQQIQSSAKIFLPKTNERKELTSVFIPSLQDDGYKIALEIISAEGEGLSLEFLTVLFEQLIELLNLRNFNLGGGSLQIQELEVHPEKLLLQARTVIKKIPKT